MTASYWLTWTPALSSNSTSRHWLASPTTVQQVALMVALSPFACTGYAAVALAQRADAG